MNLQFIITKILEKGRDLTMKIAIIGANGKAGQLITQEAIQRGFDVTAIVRRADSIQVDQVMEKDVLSLTTADLTGFDAVVVATGFWTPDLFHLFEDAHRHLAQLLSGTDTRLVVVGGAGSLFTDKAHTATSEFPEDFVPFIQASNSGLAVLRLFSNVAWTYFSPALEFDFEGRKTGRYTLGGEEIIHNATGESYISYADYATALVDELEHARFIRQRFTAVSDR